MAACLRYTLIALMKPVIFCRFLAVQHHPFYIACFLHWLNPAGVVKCNLWKQILLVQPQTVKSGPLICMYNHAHTSHIFEKFKPHQLV